jgi:hypothetical protein
MHPSFRERPFKEGHEFRLTHGRKIHLFDNLGSFSTQPHIQNTLLCLLTPLQILCFHLERDQKNVKNSDRRKKLGFYIAHTTSEKLAR